MLTKLQRLQNRLYLLRWFYRLNRELLNETRLYSATKALIELYILERQLEEMRR